MTAGQPASSRGNDGETYRNDFIEIFNRGTTTVACAATNNPLQYTSQAGNFNGTAANDKFKPTFQIPHCAGGAPQVNAARIVSITSTASTFQTLQVRSQDII